jgi:ribosome-binding ATPase YchF (GTP1/OBG family)
VNLANVVILPLLSLTLQNKGVGGSTLQALTSVDLILHVLRQFEDENVTNYYTSIDPLRDMEIVNNEILQFVSALSLSIRYLRHRF